jgi:protein SCO1/2
MNRPMCRAALIGARIAAAAWASLAWASFAAAAVYPGARAPAVAIAQRLGAQLPLDARFVDADGHAVHFGDYFRASAAHDAVPVVLVLGYYHCPNLCETVMEGAVEALAESGLSRRAFRILAVSIDPAETAADAQARRRIDLQVADLAAVRTGDHQAAKEPLVLDALVGDAGAIASLTRQAGFTFVRADDDGVAADGADRTGRTAFAHAAGFLVATPDGRVSRYFLGVRHDPAALRAAIDDAASRSVGGLVDQLVLLCAHLDPTLGRYSANVMFGLRFGSLALAALLALWIWRHRRGSAARS